MSLWEPRSGTLLIKIRGHEDSVNEVQFYPVISSKSVPIIFSVGDNSCRVWHPLRKRGKQLQMIKQHRLGLEVCLPFQVIIYFFAVIIEIIVATYNYVHAIMYSIRYIQWPGMT